MRAAPCLIVALVVTALAPAVQAAPAACRGFNGTWTTDYGVVRFRTTAASATGDYSWSGTGTITGSLSGGGLSGRWKDGTGDGTLSLKLSPGNRAFTGTWVRLSGTGNAGGSGNGTCGGVMPPPAPKARPASPTPPGAFEKNLR